LEGQSNDEIQNWAEMVEKFDNKSYRDAFFEEISKARSHSTATIDDEKN